jgi:PAS domain S-box-containing protein
VTRLLAAVVQSVGDAIVAADAEAAVVHLNPAAERLFGVRSGEVAGRGLVEAIMHPDEHDRAREWARRLAAGERLPAGLQARLIRADGTTFAGRLDLFAVRDDEGAVLGMAGVVREVVERRAADTASAALRAVVASAAEAIVRVDEHDRVHLFSPAAERMYGYAADEVVGHPVQMLVADHRRAGVGDLLARVRAGEAVRGETVARRRDGSDFEVEFSAHPMIDARGGNRGTAITLLDVSERRRTQRLLDRIVEHAPAVISVKDLAGHYRLFNRRGAETMGLDPDAVLGCTDAELFDAETAAMFVEGDRQVIAAGRPMTFTEQFPGPDGPRYLLTTKFPIAGVDGGIDGVGVIAADVTELRRAEADRALLAALVQSAPEAIVAQDADGRIVSWNPGAEAMFGLTAAEAIGRDYAETLVPDSDRATFQALRGEVRVGQVVSMRSPRRRANGSVFPASISAAPVKLDGSWGTLAMIRDVTDLVAAEAELEARREQLERSNADLERFAYAASHDLQEPLASIRLSAGAVIEAAGERLGADERELLGHIDAAATRLSDQVRGLMQVAKVALGDVPAERAPLATAVAEARDALRAAAQEAEARLDVLEPLPDVPVPRAEMTLVLQNLLANGIKYHRPGVPPRITLTASSGDAHVEVRVTDNGVGLSAEDRVRVFGLFERVQPGVPGTGMGLAVARRMVERHGGTIAVASPGPGRGSEFIVRLPLSA